MNFKPVFKYWQGTRKTMFFLVIKEVEVTENLEAIQGELRADLTGLVNLIPALDNGIAIQYPPSMVIAA